MRYLTDIVWNTLESEGINCATKEEALLFKYMLEKTVKSCYLLDRSSGIRIKWK